jgi:hypothetical protein
VLGRVGDVFEVVVALVLGPLEHRHSPSGGSTTIDRRLSLVLCVWSANSGAGLMFAVLCAVAAATGALGSAAGASNGVRIEVEPRTLDVGLAVGRARRLPLLRRLRREARDGHERCQRRNPQAGR